ncbi:hypothetical protein MYP_3651 [Sporocytophaga myxococcoides]|uniref:Uncharacterized protein n=1 Tax=Sporocytophaga myxococcoides TaxID=153721 RepID=A0A098LJ61_9BACT|nr:hypothetical protein MYP_3651 [Sporocytophaga myxococcoides]
MYNLFYFLIIDSIPFVAGLLMMNKSFLIKQNTMAMFTETGLEAVIKNNSNKIEK